MDVRPHTCRPPIEAREHRRSPLRTDFPIIFFFLMIRPPPRSPLFPYPTLFRSGSADTAAVPAATRSTSPGGRRGRDRRRATRSEEHTSEIQSRLQLVCRLLL